jgi:hypothetical protein
MALRRSQNIYPTLNVSDSRYISKNGREIAEDATQIFGGRALTVSGMGKLVENVSLIVVSLDAVLILVLVAGAGCLIHSSTVHQVSTLFLQERKMS